MCKDKKIRVNVTFSESILLSIDAHARVQGLSRSAYLTKLESDVNENIKRYIHEHSNQDYYLDLPVNPDSPLYEE